MEWFNTALASVKQGAAEFEKNAKFIGEQVKKQVNETIDTEGIKRALDGTEGQKPDEGPVADDDKALWDVVPAGWELRRGEWRALTRNLHLDVNTFLVGPAGRTAPAHIDWEPTEPSAKRQIACAEFDPLEEVRYRLVPKLVSDDTFWLNYNWKARELAQCTSTDEVEAMLRELNTDPNGALPQGERKKNRGVVQEEDMAKVIAAVLRKEEANSRRTADLVRKVLDEVKTSEENASLLTRILGRRATTNADLLASVYDSCKYHKQKVAELQAQLGDEAEDVREAVPPGRLEAAAEQLAAAITLYESGDAADAAAAPTPSPKAGETADASHAPEAEMPAAASTGKEGDDYFGGAMPWEDDATTTPPAANEGDSWEDGAPSSPELK